MNLEWVNKTCLKCVFNINDQCRKAPPTPVIYTGGRSSTYPPIKIYTIACSEYKEAE